MSEPSSFLAGEQINFRGGSRQDSAGDQEPLVSLIVVVFRAREELGELLANLIPFRGPEVELIVIDGGSQDGSVDLLQQHNHEIDFWLSQRDGGIYDAMNKGVAAAGGRYILHINAGDRLLRLPLVELNELALRQVDVVCCRVVEDEIHIYKPRNDWLIKIDNPWHHQGTFYRRGAHLGYDPSYRVFGDFDHNQRLRKAKKTVAILAITVATHKTDGASSDKETRSEVLRSIRANSGPFYLLPAIARFHLIGLGEFARKVLRSSSHRT